MLLRSSRLLLAFFVLFLGVALVAEDADARRLGGGRSVGRQSDHVSQRSAQPPQQNSSQQQAASQPQQNGPMAPQPQPPRNRWLGPIAGLAAGLGIAALLSHFGLGAAMAEALGSMLLIGLLVIAGVFVFRMLRGTKPAARPQPAYAGSVSPMRREYEEPVRPSVPASPPPAGGEPVSVTGRPLPALNTAAVPASSWDIPADFDTNSFLRSAKVHFVRLQAAWDAGDLDDIREFTTPEMFAEIKLDLSEHGGTANQTDVAELEAELLGIEQQARTAMASVRFHGKIREAPGAAAEPFSEVWNLVKPLAGRDGWLLAGIQQAPRP